MSSNPFGIRFDKLLALPEGHVIDAIPPAERLDYWLRGASLGSLALNLAAGANRVNPRNNLPIHVAHSQIEWDYTYARSHAESLARQGTPVHFSEAERAAFSEIVGVEVDSVAGVVFGIEPGKFDLAPHPSSDKLTIMQEVGFGDIDPHSLAALSELFGVDLASLPATPGVQTPEYTSYRPHLRGFGG